MSQPDEVWVVKTVRQDLHGWYYAAVEEETDAKELVSHRCCEGETVTAAKRVKNVGHLEQGDVRPVPVGDYLGPLIPH